MALRANQKQWQEHLSNLGIPESHSEEYARTFIEQDVSPDLLKFISDSELQDTYHIQLGGHRLAIRHSVKQLGNQHTTEQLTNPLSFKPNVRHQPPQLQPNMTPSSFRAFKSHWEVYKSLVGIPLNSRDAAAQIFSLACTDHPQIM